MYKSWLVAAAILMAAVSSASAQFVSWRGGAVISNVTNACTAAGGPGFRDGQFFSAQYRHPNLGMNSANAQLTFYLMQSVFNYMATGKLPTTMKKVTGRSIGGGFVQYTPRMRVTKMTPKTINANTPNVYIVGRIEGFSGFTGSQNCDVTFEASMVR